MLVTAYLSFGLLVGLLTGLASSPIANAFLTTLFVFSGGTVTYVLSTKSINRREVGKIMTSFSMACIIGLLSGIAIKENRLLSRVTLSASKDAAEPYLKSDISTDAAKINDQLALGKIDVREAYSRLRSLLENESGESKK